MRGVVTLADHVRGERRGQRVRRRWDFAASCRGGTCPSVALRRERTRRKVDRLLLRPRSGGVYSGSGRFYVALRCGRRTYRRGGIASMTIRVRATRTAIVQGKPFATRIAATYVNPRRINTTPCPGGIGRDAARYSGRLSTPVPRPPAGDFGLRQPDTAATTVQFADASRRARGSARIVAWRWDFGDPGTGARNRAAGRSASHRFSSHGVFAVTITVRDATGLTDTVTKNVLV